MYKDLLTHSPLLALPLAALLIFFAVFVLVVVRAMSKRATEYASAENLPLANDAPAARGSQEHDDERR